MPDAVARCASRPDRFAASNTLHTYVHTYIHTYTDVFINAHIIMAYMLQHTLCLQFQLHLKRFSSHPGVVEILICMYVCMYVCKYLWLCELRLQDSYGCQVENIHNNVCMYICMYVCENVSHIISLYPTVTFSFEFATCCNLSRAPFPSSALRLI
jgi:hypothetical protein